MLNRICQNGTDNRLHGNLGRNNRQAAIINRSHINAVRSKAGTRNRPLMHVDCRRYGADERITAVNSIGIMVHALLNDCRRANRIGRPGYAYVADLSLS